MSLNGKATAKNVLRGKINKVDVIHYDTYQIAVKNGFEGTVEEWLASLKGEPGKDYVLTEGDRKEIADMVLAELPEVEPAATYTGEVEVV